MAISPRIYDNLPAYARLADETGILQHIADAVQPEIDEMIRLLDNQSHLFDPAVTPGRFLNYLGQYVGLAPIGEIWQGLGMNSAWSDAYKRQVIARAWSYFQRKGTLQGVTDAIDIWLQFPEAQTNKLIIRLPFGKHPTDHPPNWWTYDTPYGSDLNQTYIEKQHLGGDGYGGHYKPDWFTLETDEFKWAYDGTQWSDGNLIQIEAPEVRDRSSHLGPGKPWEHLSLNPSNWNKIFPDIYRLNPEIWDALADPTVFGWLNLSAPKALRIERNQNIPTTEDVLEIFLDGMQYGDGIYGGTLWPYLSLPSRVESVPITVTRTFGLYPGFQYNSSILNDGSQWFVSYGNYTLTETVSLEIPEVPCNIGVQDTYLDHYETVLVGGVDAVESSQLLDVIPAFKTTVILVPEYAGMVGFEWFDQWLSNEPQPYDIAVEYESLKISDFQTPISSLKVSLSPINLSINSSLSVDMGNLRVNTYSVQQFAPPPVIRNISMPYSVLSFDGLEFDWGAGNRSETVRIDWSENTYTNRIYRFNQLPIDSSDVWQSAPTTLVSEVTYTPAVINLEPSSLGYIWLYNSSVYDNGDQWFFAGTPKIEPSLQNVPHYETVRLCNVAENWSTEKITSLIQSQVDLPPNVLSLFDLYPIIDSVSNAQNWRLMLETLEGVYVVPPATMFWSDVLGAGDPSKRSQGINLDTGLTNLYLEFIIQPQVASRLRSVTLLLKDQVIKSADFPDALDFSDPGCFGFRFSIPLRFPSGASSTDENLAILEFFPALIEGISKVDTDYASLPIQINRDVPVPLIPPSNSDGITEESLKDLLSRVIQHVDRLDIDVSSLRNFEDKQYTHYQTSLSDRWFIQHDLGKEPSVTVILDDDLAVIADLDYSVPNVVVVILDRLMTGRAICN